MKSLNARPGRWRRTRSQRESTRAIPLAGLLACIVPLSAKAQDVSARAIAEESSYVRNALYIELLGAGIFPTLNYELRATRHVSGRVGFLWLPDGDRDIFIVPLMAFWLAGKGPSRLELGAGPTFLFNARKDGHRHIASLAIGYRYQPDGGGELFRIAWTPLFALDGEPVILSSRFEGGYWGVSAGAVF